MSSRIQDKRLWLGGGAAIAVLIVVAGWFFVINPELTAAASYRDQTDAAAQQNAVLQAKNAKLMIENGQAATLREGLAASLAELPFDSGLPEFTRQVSAQATASSVALTSVVVGGAAAVPPAAGDVAATTAAAATDAATTTAATPTAAAATTGLVAIPITLVATGLGSDLTAFITAIQVDGPRRALVTDSQMAPAGGDAAAGIQGNSTLTLQLTIFSNPLSPDAQAALEKLLSGE